jgi:hypothetical protein
MTLRHHAIVQGADGSRQRPDRGDGPARLPRRRAPGRKPGRRRHRGRRHHPPTERRARPPQSATGRGRYPGVTPTCSRRRPDSAPGTTPFPSSGRPGRPHHVSSHGDSLDAPDFTRLSAMCHSSSAVYAPVASVSQSSSTAILRRQGRDRGDMTRNRRCPSVTYVPAVHERSRCSDAGTPDASMKSGPTVMAVSSGALSGVRHSGPFVRRLEGFVVLGASRSQAQADHGEDRGRQDACAHKGGGGG